MFTGTREAAAEDLNAHSAGVKELLSRLGWQVDSVTVAVGDTGHAVRESDLPGGEDAPLDQWL